MLVQARRSRAATKRTIPKQIRVISACLLNGAPPRIDERLPRTATLPLMGQSHDGLATLAAPEGHIDITHEKEKKRRHLPLMDLTSVHGPRLGAYHSRPGPARRGQVSGAGLPERGQIAEMLAEEAAEVQFGQALFQIKPAA
jgi:hypothetical protein